MPSRQATPDEPKQLVSRKETIKQLEQLISRLEAICQELNCTEAKDLIDQARSYTAKLKQYGDDND